MLTLSLIPISSISFRHWQYIQFKKIFKGAKKLIGLKRDFDDSELLERDFEDSEELFERDFDDSELLERDFEDSEELFERDFEPESELFERGRAN
jgi:hypothetical protein